jgi:AcrR family transcriptional regulator
MARVRISKEYDERLKELLEAAQELFFQKGYHHVSIKDIIDKVGVAKGTFYHYFKSKEDLLDRLVEQFSKNALARVTRALDEARDLNVLEKLNVFFIATRDAKAESKELMLLLMKVMYTDRNLLFRHKVFKRNIKLMAPVFSSIIRQGMDEGVFNPMDADETAQLIFSMGINMNEEVVKMLLELEEKPGNLEIIEKKIEVYEQSIERILGAREGSIRFADRKYLDMFKPEHLEDGDEK